MGMMNTTLLMLVVVLIMSCGAAGKNPDWLFQSEEQWDTQWSKGNWNYMDQVPIERTKVAVITELSKLYGRNSSTAHISPGGILDVGCGEGSVLDFISPEFKKSYVGIDISKEAIRAAKTKRPHGRFLHAAAHSFTLHPRRAGVKFNTIFFSDVLYYIDHESTMKRYNDELLTDDGIVIISIFQKPDTNQVLYEEIFESARKIWDKKEEIFLSGTTKKTAHSSGVVTAKTGFRIEVFQKKQ